VSRIWLCRIQDYDEEEEEALTCTPHTYMMKWNSKVRNGSYLL